MRQLVVQLPGPYSMPPVCVSCGAPAGGETINVGQSNAKGTRAVSLNFPVCDACHQASKAYNKGGMGCLVAFVTFFVAYGLLAWVFGLFLKDFAGWIGLFGGAVVAYFAGVYTKRALADRRMTPDDVERAKAVDKAVQMPAMHLSAFGKQTMTLRFESDAYAWAFETANPGWIVRS